MSWCDGDGNSSGDDDLSAFYGYSAVNDVHECLRLAVLFREAAEAPKKAMSMRGALGGPRHRRNACIESVTDDE